MGRLARLGQNPKSESRIPKQITNPNDRNVRFEIVSDFVLWISSKSLRRHLRFEGASVCPDRHAVVDRHQVGHGSFVDRIGQEVDVTINEQHVDAATMQTPRRR